MQVAIIADLFDQMKNLAAKKINIASKKDQNPLPI